MMMRVVVMVMMKMIIVMIIVVMMILHETAWIFFLLHVGGAVGTEPACPRIGREVLGRFDGCLLI